MKITLLNPSVLVALGQPARVTFTLTPAKFRAWLKGDLSLPAVARAWLSSLAADRVAPLTWADVKAAVQ